MAFHRALAKHPVQCPLAIAPDDPRRRKPGNDGCIIELGTAGIIERIEVDTAHFRSNDPDRCSVQAARAEGCAARSPMCASTSSPTEAFTPKAG